MRIFEIEDWDNGRQLRRVEWNEGSWIIKSPGTAAFFDEDGGFYPFDAGDLLADDWMARIDAHKQHIGLHSEIALMMKKEKHEQRRFDAASRALFTIIGESVHDEECSVIAESAVRIADALLAELEK